MKLQGALELAREGRLYPSLILHGGDAETRFDAALQLSRSLLCREASGQRPCGSCRHCRRIRGDDSEVFHPDFRVLDRDLATTTSVGATRAFLRLASLTPFESRGQVFVVRQAETLSGEAANALLKVLEEPPASAPRNFLLLCPSRLDLLPTVRSRSWSLFLGPRQAVDAGAVQALAEDLALILGSNASRYGGFERLAVAQALIGAGASSWKDPREESGFALGAAALLEVAGQSPHRRALLDLANAFLEAPRFRLRFISAERIVEGLVARHLGVLD